MEDNKHLSPVNFDPKKDPKFTWWEEIEMFFRWKIIDPIRQFPREVKYFFQRGIRGWSDRDIWGFDYFLAGVILNGLVQLRATKHGYPATMDPVTGKREYDEKRWDDILDRMIAGFALLKKCADAEELEYGGWIVATEEYTEEEERTRMNTIFKDLCRFTTKEEEKQIEEAFNLFRDHFFSLWD